MPALPAFGRAFSAAEAYRIGLVHEIVPGEETRRSDRRDHRQPPEERPERAGRMQALLRIIAGQPIDDATVEETTQRAAIVRSTPKDTKD